MPDRDYIPRSVPKGWRQACRLFHEFGDSPEAVTATARAIAGAIRRGELDASNGSDLLPTVSQLLEANVLGPARIRSLPRFGSDEVARREQALRTALLPEIERFREQIQNGKCPSIRPRPRLSGEATLRVSIPVQ